MIFFKYLNAAIFGNIFNNIYTHRYSSSVKIVPWKKIDKPRKTQSLFLPPY